MGDNNTTTTNSIPIRLRYDDVALRTDLPYTLYLSPFCDKTRAFIYPAVDSSSNQLNPRFYKPRTKINIGIPYAQVPRGYW